jgi:uncharacterized Ntn-hydrolase superfamily protein
MPFAKGQSGNPSGRPRKGKTLTEALEKALNAKAEDGKKKREKLAATLIDLAINEKNITAIKYIMDRVDGRPTESIELTDGAVDQRLREIMNGGN